MNFSAFTASVRFVEQAQPGLPAGPDAPRNLGEAERQKRVAERQHREKYPARNWNVLGVNADQVHLVDVDGAAVEHQQGIGQAAADGGKREVTLGLWQLQAGSLGCENRRLLNVPLNQRRCNRAHFAAAGDCRLRWPGVRVRPGVRAQLFAMRRARSGVTLRTARGRA
ncbi:MAG: hypothetical protein O3A88_03620 [Proteobacteria bacterium]|nr:hypothetical protein [Pseudomonadota bacterium]